VRVELAIDQAPRSLGPARFGGGQRIRVEGVAREVARPEGRAVRLVAFVTQPDTAGEGGPGGALRRGDRVVLRGRAEVSEPEVRARVILPGAIVGEIAAPDGWMGEIAALRSGLTSAAEVLPGDAGALVPGIAIGDVSALDRELDAAMKDSSLTHITAVSGAHVAIILGTVLALAAACRVPRAGQVALGGLGLGFFVLLVGPAPSVLRSALMGGVTLLALGVGRGRTALGALGLSVIFLVAVDPWMARDYGFALSVVATAALIVVAPRWQRWLEGYMPRGLAAVIAVPAAAQAACAPIIVVFAGRVSMVGVLANIVAAPAVPLATTCGVLACLLIPAGGWLAVVPLHLAGAGAWWIARVARWSVRLPGAVISWPASAAGALGLLAATAACCFVLAWAMRRRQRRVVAGFVLAGCVCVALSPLGPWLGRAVRTARAGPWAQDWQIAVCDVGQGTAVAIRSGPSSAVMVDAGPAAGHVGACLDALGVDRVEGIVLSHLHEDHAGGLDELTARAASPVILTPAVCGQPNPPGATVVASATQSGAPVRLTAGSATLEVFPSPLDVRCRASSQASSDSVVNDASLAVHAHVANLDAWILGDLELAGQAAFARTAALIEDPPDTGPNHGTTLAVVAHHGSAKQDRALARALAPDIAIFSAGADNDYGHPTDTALDLYAEVGAAIVRTDRDGHIAIRADGSLAASKTPDPPVTQQPDA
jgi:competence protein ComEC